jgi:homoserine dehydrogenase
MHTLRVALLGCGTVGHGVLRLIHENGDSIAQRRSIRFDVVGVGVRDLAKPRQTYGYKLTDDLSGLMAQDIDVAIEAMGGVEPTLRLLEGALERGVSVATANKELMAKHGAHLIAVARAHRAELRYEASVAAGIPVIAALDRQLAANRVARIQGILNGTTNYMLSRMADEGLSFDQALQICQELGYAEADPTADVDGFDAAYKLTILASIASGHWQDWNRVQRQGIRGVSLQDLDRAKRNGQRIRLLAEYRAEGHGHLSVIPVAVSADHPLFGVHGSTNAVVIDAEPVGTVTLVGPGAGAGPTASALMGDAVEIGCNLALGIRTIPHAWRSEAIE